MRLGWIDLTLKADGETYCVEGEVTGSLKAKWIGEKAELEIEGVYLTGADAKVNILPVLTGEQVRAIAKEVRPQAELRRNRPDLYGEAA